MEERIELEAMDTGRIDEIIESVPEPVAGPSNTSEIEEAVQEQPVAGPSGIQESVAPTIPVSDWNLCFPPVRPLFRPGTERVVYVDPTFVSAMDQLDRIMLSSWLVFLLVILIVVISFYTWTFITVGIPSKSIRVGYGLVVIFSSILFIFFIFGLIGIRTVKPGEHKPCFIAFNATLGVILLFDMAITLLFGQYVDRKEIVHFLSERQLGSTTFVDYIHRKFNCCVVMSLEELSTSTFGFQMLATKTTMSPLEMAESFNLCPTDGYHNESCFKTGEVETLEQLLYKDGEAYAVHMVMTYLPIVLVVGVIILMTLVNFYTCCYGSDPDFFTPTTTVVVEKEYNENSFASIICSGFARFSGTRLPPPRDTPLQGRRARPTSIEEMTETETISETSTPTPTPRRQDPTGPIRSALYTNAEGLAMKELRPKKKVRIVEAVDVHQIQEQGQEQDQEQEQYQESEMI